VSQIIEAHVAQLLNDLAASERPIGLILNFGKPEVEIKRVVR